MSSSGKPKGREESERRSAGRAKLLQQIRRRFQEHATKSGRSTRRQRP